MSILDRIRGSTPLPDMTRVTLSFLTLDGSWFAYVRTPDDKVFAGAGSDRDAAVLDALRLAFPPPDPLVTYTDPAGGPDWEPREDEA